MLSDGATVGPNFALTTLMSQIAANTAGVVVDGATYASSTSTFPFTGLLSTTGSTGGPKAYINWLIFDRNYTLLNGGYTRMSATPKEQGQDIAHELMASPTINITQPGYVYIYLSNEETTPVEVYFDDFRVTHVKSPVVQTDDYYPFGLTFNSYERENAIKNQYLFTGKENQDELDIDWLDFGARMYQSELARWNAIDRSAEKYVNQSPYHYSGNNPTLYVDFDGNDFGLSVDQRSKTITVKAVFLAQAGQQLSNAKSGASVWANANEKYVYMVGKGNSRQGYKIAFNAQARESKNPNSEVDSDKSGTLNSYTEKKFKSTSHADGYLQASDKAVADIDKADKSTASHEFGHQFGLVDSNGVMNPEDTGTGSVDLAHITEILNGVGLAGKDDGSEKRAMGLGVGTLSGDSLDDNFKKGKVITANRWIRIQKRITKRLAKESESQD